MSRQAKACFTALAVLAAALTAAPQLARADAQQQQSFTVWNGMSNCAKQAAQQFPDHTPEGNAKREAARQECLRVHHLPMTPPPPP